MEVKSKLNDYILGRKLGSGQYSKVREGFRDSQKYAVKYMKSTNPALTTTYLELIMNEVKAMSVLSHPNIIKLHEFSDKGVIEKPNGSKFPALYLVLDLITGGELYDYVAVSGRFSDKIARHYFHQLIDALEFVHRKGFVHRDIKAENLLLDSDYNLKLADFGFSAPIAGKDGSGLLHTGRGTEGYMAPELFTHQPYSGEKVDLFAVGVLLFIMISQHPPFRKAVSQDRLYKLFCQHNDIYWERVAAAKPAGTLSPELKELLNALMAFDSSVRPSIQTIKACSWYNGPLATPEELRLEFSQRRAKVETDWKVKAEEAKGRKNMKCTKPNCKPYAVTRDLDLGGYDEKFLKTKLLPVYKVFPSYK